MRLVDCEPEFVRTQGPSQVRRVASIQVADGILFQCPKCHRHSILAWFRGRILPGTFNGDMRWSVFGTDTTNMTLQPDNAVTYPCRWKAAVRQGTL